MCDVLLSVANAILSVSGRYQVALSASSKRRDDRLSDSNLYGRDVADRNRLLDSSIVL